MSTDKYYLAWCNPHGLGSASECSSFLPAGFWMGGGTLQGVFSPRCAHQSPRCAAVYLHAYPGKINPLCVAPQKELICLGWSHQSCGTRGSCIECQGCWNIHNGPSLPPWHGDRAGTIRWHHQYKASFTIIIPSDSIQGYEIIHFELMQKYRLCLKVWALP